MLNEDGEGKADLVTKKESKRIIYKEQQASLCWQHGAMCMESSSLTPPPLPDSLDFTVELFILDMMKPKANHIRYIVLPHWIVTMGRKMHSLSSYTQRTHFLSKKKTKKKLANLCV